MITSDIFKNVQMEDILEDPHKYGLPTISEFAKNKERWRTKDNANDLLGAMTGPTQLLNGIEITRIFEFNGFRTKSENKFAQMLEDHGIKIDDMEFWGDLENQGGHRANVIIRVRKKRV